MIWKPDSIPDLTARINKYKDAVWFQGNGIRWMIRDQEGHHVYCDLCGNIANGVLTELVERYVLKVPLCRNHLQIFMKEHPEYVWNERALVLISEKEQNILIAKKQQEINQLTSDQ